MVGWHEGEDDGAMSESRCTEVKQRMEKCQEKFRQFILLPRETQTRGFLSEQPTEVCFCFSQELFILICFPGGLSYRNFLSCDLRQERSEMQYQRSESWLNSGILSYLPPFYFILGKEIRNSQVNIPYWISYCLHRNKIHCNQESSVSPRPFS